MVIVSFFGLVLTGIPLHFSQERWARFIIRLHGGVEFAGLLHRGCAIITFAYFLYHILTIVRRLFSAQGRQSLFSGGSTMLPRMKDIRDIGGMFRWFVRGGPRPAFDRYSYLEKFDYWAVFWGVAVIGGSGLLLWFPELFGRFVPGWVFNLATIVHGEEALLALCFIFTVHFFNGQLRPGKFPLDLVIFTGRATEEYMEDEHPLELERLAASGRLQQLVAPPPPRWLIIGAAIIGGASIVLGLSIAGLVIWASLQ
jgi:cytochrome b subunit of formate dehydrogenase